MSEKMIVGVFPNRASADKAIKGLKAAGYSESQIGMVAKDESGKTVKMDADGVVETNTVSGAAIGAAAGGATAAVVSAGMMAGIIPVIGPILAIGPLAAALLNVAGGAAAAGLAGALIGMGLPKEDATFYEAEVTAGRYLVTVDKNNPANDARKIYSTHGGYDRLTAPKVTV